MEKDNLTQIVENLVREIWKKSQQGKFVAIVQTPEEIRESLLHTSPDYTGRAKQYLEEEARKLGIDGLHCENLTFDAGIVDTYAYMMYVPKNPELYQ